MIAPAKEESQRSIGESLRLLSRLKATDAPSAVLIREPRIPAQTHVDGQAGIYTPVVLHEPTPFNAREIEVETSGLRELGHLAKHEVGHIVSREVVVEIKLAVFLESVSHGRADSQRLSAKMKLVGPFDIGDVLSVG